MWYQFGNNFLIIKAGKTFLINAFICKPKIFMWIWVIHKWELFQLQQKCVSYKVNCVSCGNTAHLLFSKSATASQNTQSAWLFELIIYFVIICHFSVFISVLLSNVDTPFWLLLILLLLVSSSDLLHPLTPHSSWLPQCNMQGSVIYMYTTQDCKMRLQVVTPPWLWDYAMLYLGNIIFLFTELVSSSVSSELRILNFAAPCDTCHVIPVMSQYQSNNICVQQITTEILYLWMFGYIHWGPTQLICYGQNHPWSTVTRM